MLAEVGLDDVVEETGDREGADAASGGGDGGEVSTGADRGGKITF